MIGYGGGDNGGDNGDDNGVLGGGDNGAAWVLRLLWTGYMALLMGGGIIYLLRGSVWMETCYLFVYWRFLDRNNKAASLGAMAFQKKKKKSSKDQD